MIKVKKVILETEFMRLDVEDGVAGSLHIQRFSNEINPNKKEQIIINTEDEAKEVIKLIENGIKFLNGQN